MGEVVGSWPKAKGKNATKRELSRAEFKEEVSKLGLCAAGPHTQCPAALH